LAETGTLRVSEAVHLAHALVTRLAEECGIRILFVKGPTAVRLGARPPRPSSDVDVLCEPDGIERLGAALERCGWRRRVPETANRQLVHAAKYLFEHSVHYIHDEWPCDLDIHYNFPGFLAPDDVVFEQLWERRASAEVAHWQVPCADFLGQAAIVGLHALRDPGVARNRADLEHLSAAVGRLDPADKSTLSTLAAGTGCSETLRPLLQSAQIPVPASPWSDPEALRRWTVRTHNAGVPTTSWLIELRHSPWRHRPALLWRALFLPGDQLLSGHIGLEPNRRNILRLQMRRWGRAARNLPRGIRAARGSERDLL
jgi:hypothetical protein